MSPKSFSLWTLALIAGVVAASAARATQVECHVLRKLDLGFHNRTPFLVMGNLSDGEEITTEIIAVSETADDAIAAQGDGSRICIKGNQVPSLRKIFVYSAQAETPPPRN